MNCNSKFEKNCAAVPPHFVGKSFEFYVFQLSGFCAKLWDVC
jgi:hypothetical protein